MDPTFDNFLVRSGLPEATLHPTPEKFGHDNGQGHDEDEGRAQHPCMDVLEVFVFGVVGLLSG